MHRRDTPPHASNAGCASFRNARSVGFRANDVVSPWIREWTLLA